MIEVLVKSGSLIAIIVLGYILKKRNFFKPSDFKLISKIIMNITLPCAVIMNFSKLSISSSLVIIVVIGLLCNLIMIFIGYFTSLKKNNMDKAFSVINYSGYNIGSFCMPFVQSFLPSIGVVSACLFDVGNAVMCTGVTFSIASAITNTKKTTIIKFVKKIISSVAFDTYIIMLIISLLQVTLPKGILVFADTVGSANAFLAMLMIGIGLEIKIDKNYVNVISKFIVIRYSVAILLALFFYYVIPFSLDVRHALVLVAFAPVSSICPAITASCDGNVELASAINSVSILCSLAFLTFILLILYV